MHLKNAHIHPGSALQLLKTEFQRIRDKETVRRSLLL
jgi:hypothetical protein